jgi:hypothetical protein
VLSASHSAPPDLSNFERKQKEIRTRVNKTVLPSLPARLNLKQQRRDAHKMNNAISWVASWMLLLAILVHDQKQQQCCGAQQEQL